MRAPLRATLYSTACAAATIAIAACQPATTRLTERDNADAPLFAPTDLRIHPFTALKDWNGDNKPDGIEALLELDDRFREPTRATGTVLFELFEYRRNHPDPRGDRLAAWRGSLQTIEEQRARWNRISRTYTFQLAYPPIRAEHSYVLQAWFDVGGRRLTSQVILEAQEAKLANPSTIPVTQPASRPTTLPVLPIQPSQP
jgi:hypothetical protein